MDEEYSRECDARNKDIIAQLINSAPSEEIKQVIRGFDVDKDGTDIYNFISQKFRKARIVETALFLHIIADGKTVKVLAKEIIRKIDTSLLEKCAKCLQYYQVETSAISSAKCSSCGQGCHEDCYKELTQLFSEFPGVEFKCIRCTKPIGDVAPQPHRPSKEITVTDAEEVDENTTAEEQHDQQGHPPPPNQQQQDHQPLPDQRQQGQPVNVIPKCNKYRRRECPHGASGKILVDGNKCAFSHPRRCRRYCNNGNHAKYGCIKGESCEFLHPLLCRYSVRNRVCTNLECKFTHLKFTRRYEATPQSAQAGQRSTNSQNQSYPNRTQNRNSYSNQNVANQPTINVSNQPVTQVAPLQTVKPPQSEMSFLVEMVQHIKNNLEIQQREMTEMKQSFSQHQLAFPLQQHRPVYQPQQLQSMQFPLQMTRPPL